MTIGFAMVRDAPAAVCFTSGATTHTSSLSWRAAATRRARPGASIPSSLEINIRIRLPSRHGYAVSGTQFGAQSWNIRLERSEEHTSELQSRENLVCRLLLEKKK